MNKIIDFFLAQYVLKYFFIGKRWILLIPLVVSYILYIAITMGVDDITIIKLINNDNFAIPTALTFVICFLYYLLITRRSPSKKEIVIVVAKFHPLSDTTKNEAITFNDRIKEEIENKFIENNIRGEVIDIKETIDPSHPEGKKLARFLRKQYCAHILISGTVRCDQEYKFSIYIERFSKSHKHFTPSGKLKDLKYLSSLSEREVINLKENKTDDIADLAMFICGIAQLNVFKYEEAEKILSTVKKPTSEVFLYRGISEVCLKKYTEALNHFREVINIDRENIFALIFATNILYRTGNEAEANEYRERVHGLISKLSDEEITYFNKKGLLEFIVKEAVDFGEMHIEQMNKIQKSHEETHKATKKLIKSIGSFQHTSQGINYYFKGDYLNAQEEFKQCIDSDTPTAVWTYMGLTHIKLNQPELAIEALHIGLSIANSDHDHYLIAQLYAELNDKPNMLKHLNMAINKNKIYKIQAEMETAFRKYNKDEGFIELIK